MIQLNVKNTVLEVREWLQNMVVRGCLSEREMVRIVKRFSEEKQKAQEGQRFIIIEGVVIGV